MRFAQACLFSVFVATTGAALVAWANHEVAGQSLREKFVRERLAAETVAAGHAIVFPHGMTESAFRWDLAEETRTPPDVVLLGSSHGQQIGTSFFSRGSLLNLCVPGGMFTDDLISSEILDVGKKRPRVWAVIVDPWLFDAQIDFFSWEARPLDLARIDKKLTLLGNAPRPPYFLARVEASEKKRDSSAYQLDSLLQSFDTMAQRLFDRPAIADGQSYQAPIIRADGSVQRVLENEPSAGATRALALLQFTQRSDRHRYGTFAQISPELIQVFENWIHFLQRDGERVVLIFTPYHPAIFGQIVAQPENKLKEIEAMIRTKAPLLGVDVLGSYDPSIAHVTEDEFYDGDHLRPDGFKKIFQQMPTWLSSPSVRTGDLAPTVPLSKGTQQSRTPFNLTAMVRAQSSTAKAEL